MAMKTKTDRASSAIDNNPNHYGESVITVNARGEDLGNGTTNLYIPSKPLSQEDEDTLRRLFPTQAEQVYRLLSVEALIAAIV